MRSFSLLSLALPALVAAAPVAERGLTLSKAPGTSISLTKRTKLLLAVGGVNLPFLARHLDRVAW